MNSLTDIHELLDALEQEMSDDTAQHHPGEAGGIQSSRAPPISSHGQCYSGQFVTAGEHTIAADATILRKVLRSASRIARSPLHLLDNSFVVVDAVHWKQFSMLLHSSMRFFATSDLVYAPAAVFLSGARREVVRRSFKSLSDFESALSAFVRGAFRITEEVSKEWPSRSDYTPELVLRSFSSAAHALCTIIACVYCASYFIPEKSSAVRPSGEDSLPASHLIHLFPKLRRNETSQFVSEFLGAVMRIQSLWVQLFGASDGPELSLLAPLFYRNQTISRPTVSSFGAWMWAIEGCVRYQGDIIWEPCSLMPVPVSHYAAHSDDVFKTLSGFCRYTTNRWWNPMKYIMPRVYDTFFNREMAVTQFSGAIYSLFPCLDIVPQSIPLDSQEWQSFIITQTQLAADQYRLVITVLPSLPPCSLGEIARRGLFSAMERYANSFEMFFQRETPSYLLIDISRTLFFSSLLLFETLVIWRPAQSLDGIIGNLVESMIVHIRDITIPAAAAYLASCLSAVFTRQSSAWTSLVGMGAVPDGTDLVTSTVGKVTYQNEDNPFSRGIQSLLKEIREYAEYQGTRTDAELSVEQKRMFIEVSESSCTTVFTVMSSELDTALAPEIEGVVKNSLDAVQRTPAFLRSVLADTNVASVGHQLPKTELQLAATSEFKDYNFRST